MPGRVELTISELTRVALGTPKFSKFNIAVLQHVVNLLLKKLNCENDKVTVHGLKATCIKDMLDISELNRIRFKHIRIKPIKRAETFMSAIDAMDRQIRELEEQLKEYDAKVRLANRVKPPYLWEVHEDHACVFEDMYQPNAPENKLATALLTNKFFLQGVSEKTSAPLIKRLQRQKELVINQRSAIKTLRKKMEIMSERANKIESLIYEFQMARELQEKNRKLLGETFLEVQAMLLAKCDRTILPILRHYIMELINEHEERLNVLFAELSKCQPTIKGDDFETTCISCGVSEATEAAEAAEAESNGGPKPVGNEVQYCESSYQPTGGNLCDLIKAQDIKRASADFLKASRSVTITGGQVMKSPHIKPRIKKVTHSALKPARGDFRLSIVKFKVQRVTISPFNPRTRLYEQ